MQIDRVFTLSLSNVYDELLIYRLFFSIAPLNVQK